MANINKDDKVDVQKMYEYKPPTDRVVEGTDSKIKGIFLFEQSLDLSSLVVIKLMCSMGYCRF